MRNVLFCLLILLILLTIPVSATEITAPAIEGDAATLLPSESKSFGEDLWFVLKSALQEVMPALRECCGVCLSVLAIIMLLSLLKAFNGKICAVANLCGVICISCILLKTTNAMISLGMETVAQISHYGNLLLPVLTIALASQGGTTSSAALYTGTIIFDSVLGGLIHYLLRPMVYIYLVLAIVNAAVADQTMQRMRDFVKSTMVWILKILLYVFTGYISVTGAVSGTVDQSAVKAAKMTISTAVPVIGNIMADASETILVSAGVVKNSVGIYGLLAVIAIVAVPFIKIGIQYCLLKLTCALSGLFSDKSMSAFLDDFTGSMGLLLAITGVASLLLLISIVCFLRGMG